MVLTVIVLVLAVVSQFAGEADANQNLKYYEIDFENTQVWAENVRLFYLCNPHNLREWAYLLPCRIL